MSKYIIAGISNNLYFIILVLVCTIFIHEVLVTIFVYSYNPQITKARIFKIYMDKVTLNCVQGMLVGISETIRLLFFNFFLIYTYFNIKYPMFYSFYCIFLYFLGYDWRVAGHILNLISISKRSFILKKFFSVSSLTISRPIMGKGGQNSDTIFNQWLAGLIDGDGCFQLSKKGYASLEIVMETRDKHALYQVKQKFGGAIKLRSGVNWLRYRIHNKKGLLELINAVNGEIRNPTRLLQLNKICEKYNIALIQPSPLTYESGWLSGFFDSDGSVYFNLKSSQMYITAGQKNKFILEMLPTLYGGSIYIEKTSFKWVVYKKAEVIKILEYFKICPSRSAKHNRLKGINRYLELRALKAHRSTDDSILGKAWKKFLLKWDKWEKID